MPHATTLKPLLAALVAASTLGLGACQNGQQARGDGYISLDTEEGESNPVAFEGEEEAAIRRVGRVQPNGAYAGAYQPDVPQGYSAAAMAFPTGDLESSPLLLHQVMPVTVRRSEPFEYEYHVTNVTNGQLQSVALTLDSQNNLEVLDAEPAPQPLSGGGLIWSLGDMPAGSTEVIEVTATASNLGTATNCVSVSYNNALCALVRVVEPEIELVKDVTPRSLLCEPLKLTYSVTNTGTGQATDVVIRDSLPEGLTTAEGARNVEIPIGTLAAGESATRTVAVEAESLGRVGSAATARGAGELSAESQVVETLIIAPRLELTSECPERQFLGRAADLRFTIANNGDGVARETILRVDLDAPVEVLEVSNDGVQTTPDTLSWEIGEIPPGQTRTVTAGVTSSQIGALAAEAQANAFCAGPEPSTAQCVVDFRGIPAILLEVVDIADPVEIGDTTTYVITVTNQGSAPDRQVLVVANIPPEQEFVSSGGATPGQFQDGVVRFGPVDSLAPGAAAEWRITTRAAQEADSRIQVELTSQRFDDPIRETESTNLYR